MRFKSIDIVVTMPAEFAAADRAMLEQAAGSCPIKHSFKDDIPINVRYVYPAYTESLINRDQEKCLVV